MSAQAAGACRYDCVATPRSDYEHDQHDTFVALFDQLDFERLNVVLDLLVESTAGDPERAGLPPVCDVDTFVAAHNWRDPHGALRFAKSLAELFERGRSAGERHPMPAPRPAPQVDLPIAALMPAEPGDFVVFSDDEDRPWKVRAWAVDSHGDCFPIIPPYPDEGVAPGAIRGVSWWPVDAPEDAA